jgi:hypothetical protein
MFTSRLHAVIALAGTVFLADAARFPGADVDDNQASAQFVSVSELGMGAESCLICSSEWDEEGDPENPSSWTHWFDLGSTEQCDTPVEQAENGDCSVCGEEDECHDDPINGFCHVACADILESPEQIALTVREKDLGLLAGILMHGPKNVVWNEERALIQPLRSCGLVAANIAVSSDLAKALNERLEYYNSQGLGIQPSPGSEK